MLARGVDVKTVSAILGHAKPSITLNLYSHVLEEMQERAVWAVEDLLNERSGVSSGVKSAETGPFWTQEVARGQGFEPR